jgi:hypothetical protein
MRFAKIVFRGAGAWGVLVLVPLYFAMGMIGREQPPSITHPEYYFGFLGVALVWQLAFFVIASDPVRYRSMMIPAIAEKFVHVGTMAVLFLRGIMDAKQLAFNLPDLVLGLLFVVALVRTRAEPNASTPVLQAAER